MADLITIEAPRITMEKDLPPPYSEAYAPPPGFNFPPNPVPPQPVYTVPPPQTGPAVVLTRVPQVTPLSFGPLPQVVTCSSCHQQITTRMISEPSLKTHLMAVILCVFGCIPCCLIPYCVDSCQSKNHYCSNCSAYLGTYNDMLYSSGF